jgi:hypothetical protein
MAPFFNHIDDSVWGLNLPHAILDLVGQQREIATLLLRKVHRPVARFYHLCCPCLGNISWVSQARLPSSAQE